MTMNDSLVGAPPATHDTGLVCSQLSVSYPQFQLTMDFTLNQGEFVSLIGPSGCGKSTSLQIICGLLAPESGRIYLEGKDITNTPVWEREIGLVFQSYALFPHLSVGGNIAYPLKLKKIKKRQRIERIEELLELVGLRGYEKRRVEQLSGGEQQRVALARALASSPRLLLLDEPLSALDAKMRTHLREELLRIHKETGITTLYVTHDQEEALAMSDRIILMNQGGIEHIGTPEEIYSFPATIHSALFMGDGTVLPYSVIPRTLTTPSGQTDFIYLEQTGSHQIFFRPEHVVIHDEPALPFPEFLPHIRFRDARVTACEYSGDSYRITCIWEGHTISARCSFRPRRETVTLGVRLQDIVEYIDGVLLARP